MIREAKRKWKASELGRQRFREQGKRYRAKYPEEVGAMIKAYSKRNPEKVAARNAINGAVRYGKIQKQPCEVCGATKYIHAHHDDYSQPLVVHWLCAVHHKARHAEMKRS